MKATGIVRRMDELGRIVIPKEIRRTLRIKVGDALEIYTTREGELILKKYSIATNLEEYAYSVVRGLNEKTSNIALVCDRDSIIACAGVQEKSFLGKRIHEYLDDLLSDGQTKVLNVEDGAEISPLKIDDGFDEYVAQIIVPLTTDDVVSGCVILASEKPGVKFGDEEIKQVELVASILKNHLD